MPGTVNVAGARAVVTGGGSGIGRALARRLAAGGARVAVNDLDPAAARAAAADTGGVAVPGDVSGADGVRAVVAAARDQLGDIDIYCSNAGVAAGAARAGGGAVAAGDAGTPGQDPADPGEAAWQHSWDVNVMAHVRAARELLPGWLARGTGRLVITASAAGLLTMLGTAPYSVTKHAAVAYAEWLAATYGHRGLRVHCLCPQGVRTAMLDRTGRAGDVLLRDTAIDPEAVAGAFWDGLAEGRFLILPHPEVAGYYALRASDTDKWLQGMSRLQQRIEESG